VERGPYAARAASDLHRPSAVGAGDGHWLRLLVAFAGLALFFVGFWIKLRQEERLLVRSFPEEYLLTGARPGAGSVCVVTRFRVSGGRGWPSLGFRIPPSRACAGRSQERWPTRCVGLRICGNPIGTSATHQTFGRQSAAASRIGVYHPGIRDIDGIAMKRLLPLALFASAIAATSAAAQPPEAKPLRIAIAGLNHGHVWAFSARCAIAPGPMSSIGRGLGSRCRAVGKMRLIEPPRQ